MRNNIDLDSQAVNAAAIPQQRRFQFSQLKACPGRPFVALLGPRGSGKTVMLRQLRSERKEAIYISADTLEPGDRLAEVIRTLADRYRVRSFLVDEIHFLPDYPRDLKELYDFGDFSVWFTSSVAFRFTRPVGICPGGFKSSSSSRSHSESTSPSRMV